MAKEESKEVVEQLRESLIRVYQLMEKDKLPKEGKLLTAPEMARQLRISRSKAYALLEKGKIPVVRVGSNVRVRQEDVDEYIRRNLSNGFG